MPARIIDRGRGPEIEGSRITVYDVVDYWRKGWQHDQIAGLFRLPPDDILEAVRFIEQHHDQVMAEYQQIVERHRNVQYAPEVKVRLLRNREKFQARLAELQAAKKPPRRNVPGIVADHNIEGHFQVLVRILRTDPWDEI